jgi:dihydroxyacetone kinase-like protein
MMSNIQNSKGRSILFKMVEGIQKNKDYLGEIDGLIGDGDHGMNMNKGFSVFWDRFGDDNFSLADGLNALGMLLLNEIGGSMGPIYGTIFISMGETGEDYTEIGLDEFSRMLHAGLDGLNDIIEAKPGDKTLVDTLVPAIEALDKVKVSGGSFENALIDMKAAAKTGRDSTKDLVAKFGRSSRLGERSRGVVDAGATSCQVLLEALADGMIELLKGDNKK